MNMILQVTTGNVHYTAVCLCFHFHGSAVCLQMWHLRRNESFQWKIPLSVPHQKQKQSVSETLWSLSEVISEAEAKMLCWERMEKVFYSGFPKDFLLASAFDVFTSCEKPCLEVDFQGCFPYFHSTTESITSLISCFMRPSIVCKNFYFSSINALPDLWLTANDTNSRQLPYHTPL